MKKILLGLFGVAVLGVGAHAGKLLFDAGTFRTLTNYGFDACHERARLAGAEDLEWSPALKRVVASSDHRPSKKSPNPPSGGIYTIDPAGKAPPERVSEDLPFPFHPHGIALWEEAGKVRLFAINHRPEESTVEVFDWNGKRFAHVKTLKDPLLVTPNDLIATGPEALWLSHDHGSRSHLHQQVEHYTRIGRGYVTRYDGQGFARVADGIFFANGLALDPERKLLYVAAMLEKAVHVYDVSSPEPRLTHSISLSSGPDNIKLDDEGSLWVGAHPKILVLKKHSEEHALPAPTVVMRIKDPWKAGAAGEEVMVNDGAAISAASVALPLVKQLFLGSIYDQKLLVCPRP